MEDTVKILLELPKEVNYNLMIHMAKMNLKERRTKAQEIIRLMNIGLLHESKDSK
jgi:hypothetical protein